MIRIQKALEIEPSFFQARRISGARDAVSNLIEDVRQRGDNALHDAAAKFDAVNPGTFEIPSTALKACAWRMQRENTALYDALCRSRDLAFAFAKRQRQSFDDFELEIDSSLFTGQKTIPVEKAGVYVPAGRFPLVSTVVMTMMPAIAAGVGEIVLCTPPRPCPLGSADASRQANQSETPPYADENIMAAAWICANATDISHGAMSESHGAMSESQDTMSGLAIAPKGYTAAMEPPPPSLRVFAVGGAQAIAAMAYGTQSIPPVDVIVGPGNKFVAEAKRQVYGKVGIDMIAGPTEVFIIADKSASPEWVAADLLAQAEHDEEAEPTLVTDDAALARAVAAEVEKQLAALPTCAVAEKSIANNGRIIVVGTLEDAADIANKKAPEHLEIAMDAGDRRNHIAQMVHNYGSLFIGHEAAEVLGDYAAGLNHTLPTSGSARYTGGLSVRMFLKTVTTLRAEKGSAGLLRSAIAANRLGLAEGLAAHAKAASLRMGL